MHHPTSHRKDSIYLCIPLLEQGHTQHILFMLHGMGHMVKNHSYSERGNLLPPRHGLLFPNSSKYSFICTIPHMDSTYHGLCYTNPGALAGTRNSSKGSPRRINPMILRTMSVCTTTEVHISP